MRAQIAQTSVQIFNPDKSVFIDVHKGSVIVQKLSRFLLINLVLKEVSELADRDLLTVMRKPS